MINLTTARRKSETLLATLALMLFVAPAISFGQLKESLTTPKGTDPGVSVLELSEISKRTSTELIQQPQDNPFAIQQASKPSNVTAADDLQQPQQSNAPQTNQDALELEEPQVLLRGPLHEAFAEPHQADPHPNPIVNAVPPDAIKEIPPEFKPDGNNVEWIPGYWAWDVSQDEFIWISGVWRDVPPNQRWVPGYWEQVENGNRWVAGFWTAFEQQELSYLPTPPQNLDRGPSVAAPSDDYFYCPGNWEYQNNAYVWRTGHWQPRVENWIWIPASYIWTPRGCIFRAGYWDREFDVRGTLFAPVHFQQQQHLAADFSFQPNHCVNTGADFFVHLFIQPNCNHYFYGDWYGQNFVNTGFRPWIQPQSHLRNYDPLFAHYNCARYRQGSQLLISWVNNQHQHYRLNRDQRPRNTFQAQVNFTQSNHDHRNHDFIQRANLADRYDNMVRGRGNGKNTSPLSNQLGNPNLKRNYVRTDRQDLDRHDINERIQREIRNTRKSGEQRISNQDDRNPRGETNGLTRSQLEKAQRDQEKANRKRELEQKIADAAQQAEIKRKQRETARELSERQRQQTLEQTRQKIAQEKQTRQSNRNQDSLRNNQRSAELAKQQRETQNQFAAERAKQATQQKLAQVREASRQRDFQRQQEKAAKAQADAQKRSELQARLAQEKSQRDSENRAAQQRAQQKAQADAAQRAREKLQRDAQRQASDQARRAADAAKKAQREQEQAARRAKRKKD